MKLFNSLRDSFASEIYIDLGTANTLVMESKRGLVANEPSVIAYHEDAMGKRKIIAVGNSAKEKIGRTPGGLTASRPLKDGVVAELDATEAMIKYFISSARRWSKPTLVISLPYGVSDVEKDAVRDCGMAAGAKEVKLIEEPMAAAIGSGLNVHSAKGSMIVDIGGGTTEAAVISLFGIVHCEAVRVGGHAFDEAIVEYIRRQFNLIIGEPSAEKLKISIGSAIRGFTQEVGKVRGIDFTSGLPREVTVTADQVHDAIAPLINEIVWAAKRTLAQTPPELLADIIENGVVIAGGGALLKGMDIRLAKDLNIPARVADDPLLAIARGGHYSLRNKDLLSRITLT